MKYSTHNQKNSDYEEQHVIYVGTQTGSLKRKSKFSHVFRFPRWNLLIVFLVFLFNFDQELILSTTTTRTRRQTCKAWTP